MGMLQELATKDDSDSISLLVQRVEAASMMGNDFRVWIIPLLFELFGIIFSREEFIGTHRLQLSRLR